MTPTTVAAQPGALTSTQLRRLVHLRGRVPVGSRPVRPARAEPPALPVLTVSDGAPVFVTEETRAHMWARHVTHDKHQRHDVHPTGVRACPAAAPTSRA